MSETKERFVLRECEGSYGTREELIDTDTGRVVGADGGEAEDNSFLRDWHWVPTEMNKLAAEIESLRGERDAAVAKERADVVADLRHEAAQARARQSWDIADGIDCAIACVLRRRHAGASEGA